MIISTSLNLEFGYAGIPNFGKVLAVGAGAFVAASLPGRLLAGPAGAGGGDFIGDNFAIISGVNSWLAAEPWAGAAVLAATLAAAAGTGAALGLGTSWSALRLRGDYLAITLLALGEGVRIVGNNFAPLAGGSLGVQVPDPLAFLPGEARFPAAALGLAAAAACVFLYGERLVRSPLGRLMRAVRDDETAAESLGKDVARMRMKTIMVAGAMAAVGGALYSFYVGSTIAVAYERTSWTFWPFVMILIGGLANSRGVLVGTLLFVALRKSIIYFKDSLEWLVPFDVVWLDYLLLGTVLIAVLLYRPQGLLPERPTDTSPGRRWFRRLGGG